MKPFSSKDLSLLPDSKILYLKPGTKAPDASRFPRGYKDAIPMPEIIEENWGLVLDGQYVVFDFDVDHPERESVESKMLATWRQKTERSDAYGLHYLYKVPPNFKGRNSSIITSSGVRIGDIKFSGYIVGPESVIKGPGYIYLGGQVEQASETFLEAFTSKPREESTEERLKGVPKGEHDAFLTSVRGTLLNWGLDAPTIAKTQLNMLPLLDEYDHTNPYTYEVLKRRAQSAISTMEVHKPESLNLSPEGWCSMLDTDTSQSLTTWWIYGFVPKKELVMVYGKGGIGKSTFASWLASLVASKDQTIGFCGVEEPFKRFGIRSYLADTGIPREKLGNIIDIGNQWRFPRDADRLREALTIRPLDVIYFDSIYSHFEPMEGLNMAEKTRTCLAPLAAICQEMGVTIVCVFHENKAGDFLGSVEVVNVARVVLRMSREGEGPLKVGVHKTNFSQPEYKINFHGELMNAVSLDGEPWLEENEYGEVMPLKLFVIKGYTKSTGEDEVERAIDPRWESIKSLLDQGHTQVSVSKELGIARSTLYGIISRKGLIASNKTTHIDINNI